MTVAISVQTTAGTKGRALHPGRMTNAKTDCEFARDQIGGMAFMGVAEGNSTRQRRQRDKDLLMANQE
eukprot:13851531-Heterocapsa_arctica.AAC.1